MSRTIDEKVVEMRFDNRDFERNVSQSMSTLDKLKSALDFSGAEKAFSGITSAADKVNFGGLSGALEGISDKFVSFGGKAVEAFVKIGKDGVDWLGGKIKETFKDLTLDAAFQGFDKYADKTKSVQTIMNATGKTIKEVSEQLDRLMWYTDETSYDFTEMTASIGKFTSAGIDLETAVTSMMGIGNWAGVSGAGKNEANRAMYNISQALSTGFMRKEDWKSIENANMATKEFKEAIIQSAINLGTLEEYEDGLIGVVEGAEWDKELGKYVGGTLTFKGDWENGVDFKNMASTLTEGKWLTNEVLTATLDMYGKFTTELNAVYNDISKTADITTSQIIDMTNEWKAGTLDMDQAMAMTGKSAEELEAIFANLGKDEFDLGRKALAAAQEARTFQDAIDATADAVSSGWMRTFELIFGNYEEAKVLWTDLANELWDIFAGPVSDLNDLLTAWRNNKDLGDGRDDLIEGFKNIYRAARSVIDPITEAWNAIFPPMTYDKLFAITKGFREFTESLILSEDRMNSLGNSFESIFSFIKFIGGSIKSLISAFTGNAFGGFEGFFIGISAALETVASGADNLRLTFGRISSAMEYFKDDDWLGIVEAYKKQNPILSLLVEKFLKVKDTLAVVGEYASKLLSFNEIFVNYDEAGEGLAGVINVISWGLSDIIDTVTKLVKIWTGFDISKYTDAVKNYIFSWDRLIETLQASGWLDRLKQKFDGIFEAFENRFGSVSSWFNPLREAFNSVVSDFGEGLTKIFGGQKTIGLSFLAEWIENITTFVNESELLGTVIEKFKNIIKIVSSFLTTFLSLTDAINAFNRGGGGLSGILEVVRKKLDDIVGAVIWIVEEITGLDLSWLSEAISNGFSIINKVILKAVELAKSFFSLFKKDESGDVSEFGEETEKKLTPLQALFEGLKSLFEGIWAVLQKLKPVFGAIFTKIGEVLGTIGTSLKEAFQNADPSSAFDLIMKALKIALGAGLIDFIHSLSSPFKSLSDLFDGVTDVLDGVKDALSSWQRDLQAKTLLKIAAAVGIIAVAVIALSGVDSDKLGKALSAITLLFVELIGAMGVGNELTGDKVSMKAMGTALLEIAAALLIASFAFKKIGSMELDDIGKGIVGMAAALGELVLALKLMPKDYVKDGVAMIEIAVALLLVSSVLKKIGEMDWDTLGQGLLGMGAALAELSLSIIAINRFGGGGKGGMTMILIAAALKILASALADFGDIEWGAMIRGLVGMGAALAEVVLAINFMPSGKTLLAAVGLAAMAGALMLLTIPLKTFASMSLGEIIKSLLAMAGAFVVIGGLGALFGAVAPMMLLFSAGLAAISVALLLLVPSLAALGAMSLGSLIKSLLAMASAFLIIGGLGTLFGSVAPMMLLFSAGLAAVSVSMMLLVPSLMALGSMSLGEIIKSLLAMAGAFVVIGGLGAVLGAAAPLILLFSVSIAAMGAALMLLVPSLMLLGTMSLGEIVKSLLELAGIFAVIGVAGLVLGPLTPLIVALAAAMALLGVAALAVGAGLTLFASGLALAATVGSAGITVLSTAIMMILTLIPMLITKIGEGLLKIIKMVGENAPMIAETVISVASAILDAAQTLIPKLVETVVTIVDNVLRTIAEHADSIIESVVSILLSLLNGIAEYLPDFIQSGVDIVLSLIEGLGDGLVENTERAKEAFEKLFDSILESILLFLGVDKDKAEKFVEVAHDMISGLVSGITEFATEILTEVGGLMTRIINKIKDKLPDIKEAGKNIAEGLKNGISNAKDKVVEVATSVGSKVVGAFKKVFDEHSPSEETEEQGEYLDEGLAIGIENNADRPVESAKATAESITGVMDDTLTSSAEDSGSGYINTLADSMTATMSDVAPKLATDSEALADAAATPIEERMTEMLSYVDWLAKEYPEGLEIKSPVYDFDDLKLQAGELEGLLLAFDNADDRGKEMMIREQGLDYQNENLANFLKRYWLDEPIRLENQQKQMDAITGYQAYLESQQAAQEAQTIQQQEAYTGIQAIATDMNDSRKANDEKVNLVLDEIKMNVASIRQELDGVHADINRLNEMDVFIDSDALVGATAEKYDQALGNIAKIGRRGI